MPQIDYGHQMNPWARPQHKEDDLNECLAYKREIMEMDKQHAAREAAKEDDRDV